MGASPSARRLTINNEDGVIQISTDLVQRLTHSNKDSVSLSNDATNDVKSTESSQVPSDSHQNQSRIETPAPSALPHQQHPVQAYPEYTITAYKMQQQKEMELQAQHQYWQNRLNNLKLSHEGINKVFQDEYKRAVDEISNAQGKKNINLDSVVPPCCADKEKVLQCYRENPREILKCSSVVDEFNNCVDQRRANIIAARC
ncbi:hypothetical protein PV327_007552 [Microctonus hyperodae]|uniref:MICOS complex subunit MIC19 n=1 Tax=Microctonus hyperodae TaxID=165561 RepID=A0AA39FZN9_MICHY|nr:hypothetical protein PV327_007552 [Microctonus hyperodae]